MQPYSDYEGTKPALIISPHLGNVINTTNMGIYEAEKIQSPKELGLSFLDWDSHRSSHMISDKYVPLNHPVQTFLFLPSNSSSALWTVSLHLDSISSAKHSTGACTSVIQLKPGVGCFHSLSSSWKPMPQGEGAWEEFMVGIWLLGCLRKLLPITFTWSFSLYICLLGSYTEFSGMFLKASSSSGDCSFQWSMNFKSIWSQNPFHLNGPWQVKQGKQSGNEHELRSCFLILFIC